MISPFKPNRTLDEETRIASIENYLANLHGQVQAQAKSTAAQFVQQNIEASEEGSGTGGGGTGGGGPINESQILWDDTEGHVHDGADLGTPIPFVGDVTGNNTATVVEKGRGVDFPTPGAADDWKVLSYLHSSVDYVLRHPPFKNVTKTADYTITLDDYIIFADASGGNVTITLPTAASANQLGWHIKRIDASANVCLVDGNGAETIDGAANYSLASLESITVISDGSAWWIV